MLGFLALRARQYVLLDDAYIALRYAEHAANGTGLVWNPGERVEGYTSPLWVLLLAALSKTLIALPVLAVLSSFGFAVGTLVLVGRVSRTVAKDGSSGFHWLPALLLATNPSFANAATSGMESSCFGFLLLLGVTRWMDGARRSPWAAVPAFALAYLARPEGVLAAGVVIAVELATDGATVRERVRRAVPLAASLVVLVGLHVAVRQAYYGALLPNTFYAKVIFGRTTLVRGALHLVGFLFAGGWLVLPGLRELRASPRERYAVHGYALLAAFTTYLVLVGGDHPFWYRFYVPLLPLPLVATSRVVEDWLSRRSATSRGRLGFATVFVAITGTASAAFGESRDVMGHVDPYARRAMDDVRTFFQREAPAGSLVAAQAVGHLGFYAKDVRILDMWGLNDAHIAHLAVEPTAKFGHDKFDLPYVRARKPDYFYVLVATLEPMEVPGYDVCWPSRSFPVGVYRRNFALPPGDVHLGVPTTTTRRLAPPPPCRPPPPGPRLP